MPRALPRGAFTLAATMTLATKATAARERPFPSKSPFFVALNVKLHGTSPWHPEIAKSPLLAANVKLHGTSTWHLSDFQTTSVVKGPRRSVHQCKGPIAYAEWHWSS